MSTEVANALTAYLGRNPCSPDDIPKVTSAIRDALENKPAEASGPAKATPEEIQASITPGYLVSFEDGKHYKVLRRHLRHRGLTPAEYREKWGLPSDYPLVAANFSTRRSELAKEFGLGQYGRKSSTQAA